MVDLAEAGRQERDRPIADPTPVGVLARRAQRMRRRRVLAAAIPAAVVVIGAAIAVGATRTHTQRVVAGPGPSATTTLQAAAAATANARGFTASAEGADVTYQAPDRFEQVEHGQGSTASANGNGTTGSTSAPFAETITKVFIGGRYYEADTPAGQTPSFSASARCPGSAAEYVLGILRAIATSTNIQASGDRFAFQIPKGAEVPFPTSGTASVRSGFVDGLSLSSGPSRPLSITIGSVNTAPPVTAPLSSTESNISCN